MKESVLVLCAHPDDEILGVGGTIAVYRQKGIPCTSVIFSRGESSHAWMEERHVHETRMQESLEAGGIAGTAETVFLGLRDGKLKQDAAQQSTHQRLLAIMEKVKPTKIFTHDPDDIHPDHRGVCEAVLKAYDAWSRKEKCEVYSFNIWFVNFSKHNTPKLVVDISKTFSKKIKALKVYKSQAMAMLLLTPFVYTKGWMEGFAAGCRVAESFYRLR